MLSLIVKMKKDNFTVEKYILIKISDPMYTSLEKKIFIVSYYNNKNNLFL